MSIGPLQLLAIVCDGCHQYGPVGSGDASGNRAVPGSVATDTREMLAIAREMGWYIAYPVGETKTPDHKVHSLCPDCRKKVAEAKD